MLAGLRNTWWGVIAFMAIGATAIHAAPVEKKGYVNGMAPNAINAVPFSTITGSPLTIRIGEDHSFQILNSAVPGYGQIYPTSSTGTADMGWFVRTSGGLYAPNFSQHGGTATGSLGSYTAYTPQSRSAVTGTGTSGSPFSVTVAAALGSSGLTVTEQVTYVNGRNYFIKRLTLKNNGSTSQSAKIYLGADIYLAASDYGVPFRVATSGSVGGQNCTTPATYSILFIPQTPADGYSGSGYSSIWSQIGNSTSNLSNSLTTTSCLDNGAALQWNRTIAAGASVTIQAATSFGDIPTITEFDVTSVTPSSATQGTSANVTIRGIGFQAGTTFNFGSGITVSNLAITSATTATARLTVAASATTGNRNVTGSQGGTNGLTATLTNGFSVTAPFAITSVSPNSGGQGSSVNVTIQGASFTNGTTFSFGNGITVSNVVRNGTTSATAKLTIAASATVGPRNVTGTQGGSSQTATLTNGFNVTSVSNPFSITSITPTTGSRSTTVNVTIKGIGFTAGTTFGLGSGITVSNVVRSGSTSATAKLTITATAALGARNVTGTQGGTSQTATLANGFTVTAAPTPLSISSVTPASGGQADTVNVTIRGAGFAAGTTFNFGSGITTSNVVRNGTTSATAKLVIAASAGIGPRDVAGTQGGTGQTTKLANGFKVTANVVIAATSNRMRLAAGGAHACAIDAAGQARCWGHGDYGQLGDGTSLTRSSPTAIKGPALVSLFASMEGYHSCGLTSDGAAYCWGRNNYGQLGDGTTENRSVPTAVSGLGSGVRSLALGSQHTCALLNTGGVKCWGDSSYGRLGTSASANRLLPNDVLGLDGSGTAIGAGSDHSCAVLQGGTMKCWGYNGYYQLGNGNSTSQSSPANVVLGDARVVDLSLGRYHSCALTTTGTALCWGYGGNGRLGTGSTSSSTIPTAVVGLTDKVVQIRVGEEHSCALTQTGSLLCWGYNYYGQLGFDDQNSRNTPAVVEEIGSSVRQIAAGGSFTCALTAGSVVRCWGNGYNGRLGRYGISNVSWSSAKSPVSGFPSSILRASTSDAFGCAITNANAAYCWGDNYYGQIGDGAVFNNSTSGIDSYGPRPVSGLSSRVADIATGERHACAVMADGNVWCWGYNYYGQLAGGSLDVHRTPIHVDGITNAASISAGGNHSCIVTRSGGVRCWGYNNYGQLGDGTTANRRYPVDVVGLQSGVSAISLGSNHSCALLNSGRVKCWGYNGYNTLGDNTSTSRSTPVDLADSENYKLIAAGYQHTCGVTVGGQAKCWGYAGDGRLGNGATSGYFATPFPVTGLTTGVTAIATARGYHSCAVQSGTLKCWGDNGYQQLGNRTTNDSSVPVAVLDISGPYTGLTLAEYHSCVRANGVYKCWGYTGDGRTGSGVNAPYEARNQIPTDISRFAANGTNATRLSSNVAVANRAGIAGQWSEYAITLPTGAKNLSIRTTGGTGNVHLLVQYEGQATATSYICARQTAGTAKTCEFANPAPGNYQITLFGATDYSGVTLTAGYAATLVESVSVPSLAAPEDATLSFTISVPGGMKNLSFALSGGSGNANLYVRRGSAASLAQFDCSSTASANTEACAFTNPQSGTWHVLLYGYAAFSGAKLVASYNNGASSYTLTMNKSGSGNGSIRSASGTISCGPSNWPCTVTRPAGSSVVLTPTPAAGSSFAGWTGCTSVSGTSCTVVANRAYTVTAAFSSGPPSATLRFDTATGPTTKTIVRNSGTPVTFAWKTANLPSGATCKIVLRPNDSYNKAASPAAGGTVTDTGIHTWSSGVKKLYLSCSNGTISPDVTLTINP